MRGLGRRECVLSEVQLVLVAVLEMRGEGPTTSIRDSRRHHGQASHAQSCLLCMRRKRVHKQVQMTRH